MTQQVVYIWADPKDNVLRYVGMGKPTRPYDHIKLHSRSRLSKMLHKRAREGFQLTPHRIIEAESKEDACEMEQLLIAMIGREDLGTGTLFNLTSGGEGRADFITSDATRARMSISQKKRVRPPCSDQTKKKISDKLKKRNALAMNLGVLQ